MRKIIVSGGSKGIGAAIVRRFSDAGDKVAFIYRSSDERASVVAAEAGAYAIKADVSSSKEATDAIEKAIALLGGVDTLINNAGVSHMGLLQDITDTEWDTVLNTNLSSAVYLSRAVTPEMVKQKQGRIINIGSVWGRCGASFEVAYSTTKAGLRGFTMALAKELGPSGITVNCIEPGVIRTDMNAHLTPEDIEALKDETPLCRIGEPEEVASLAYFLASDEASFITGQCIGIDGGFGA